MRTMLTVLLTVLIMAAGAQAATILIINNDKPNEGFNDATAVAPVGGNPGVTIGEQRLNVFQYAADIWGSHLPSDVTIRVGATFDALTCDAESAVLGSAGPVDLQRDFPNAEWTGTWYHVALANKLAGVDLSPDSDDIRARFNSSIDNNDNCLAGMSWYYGYDGIAGPDVALLPVILHEMGHGLGFSTMVNEADGSELGGYPDVFETFILDTTRGLHWDEMTDYQRATSATNTGNLVWDGPVTTNAALEYLSGAPMMYINAPSGMPETMTIVPAVFGPRIPETGITANVVLARDGIVPYNDACSNLANAAEINGNIALIDRNECTFVSKVERARDAGAVAVIIADNVPGTEPVLMGGDDPGDLAIPAVSVTMINGMVLKAELENGLNVTLTLDPDNLDGADALGRVLLYAPDPIEPGSSISHWDVSATPNLLMEPAINPDLNDDVDLTLPAFEEIGWFDSASGVPAAPSASGSSLSPNYPNPFNPSTTIEFRVGIAGPVQLAIYDAAGRLVRTLVNRDLVADAYAIEWDGRDNAGRPLGSGVYFYRLGTVDHSQTRQMVLLK